MFPVDPLDDDPFRRWLPNRLAPANAMGSRRMAPRSNELQFLATRVAATRATRPNGKPSRGLGAVQSNGVLRFARVFDP